MHDLLAAATEFGDAAVDVLRSVLACYEAMRAFDDEAANVPEGDLDARAN